MFDRIFSTEAFVHQLLNANCRILFGGGFLFLFRRTGDNQYNDYAAEIIFRARKGASKEELLDVVRREYDIPPLSVIRQTYRYDISCKGTFPVAFASFYESMSFEDTIRTAVSLGGDTDTNAAIAGSFAEAFYGVPDDLWEIAKTYCTDDILDVVARWEAFIHADK